MKVGELQATLEKVDSQVELMIALNGEFVPESGVTLGATGTNLIVIRAKGKDNPSKHFSIDEEGILGYLARIGLDDAEIGEVLGRPQDSIKRKRKAMGIAPVIQSK